MLNSKQTINPNSSLQHFINNKNLSMLWEVLLDELHININSSNSGPIVQNIKTVFDGNVNLFKVRANPNAGLMNLNKQFLNQLLIAVNQLFPNLKQEQLQQQNIKKINISDEILTSNEILTIDEPYKVEDIQSARQTDFEKQLINKRTEFENSINGKKPKPIDFSDKVEPELKITEMEALIAETMAKRKFDIEQLQGHNQNSGQNPSPSTKKPEKTVSFDDNITHIEHYDTQDSTQNLSQSLSQGLSQENIINTNNIFSKLKKNKSQTTYESDKLKTELEEKIDMLNLKIDKMFTLIEKITVTLDSFINK